MWRQAGFALLLGFGLLAFGVAPARAAALSPDGEALRSACSGPMQRLFAGIPAEDRGEAAAEIDGMIGDLVAASRSDVVDGRRQAAAHADSMPELSALAVCLADQRLAQLDGNSPPAGGGGPPPAGPGMSAFASGGSSDGGGGGAPEGQRPPCDLDMSDASTGVLSTESASLTNHCPVAVGYAYCVKSDNGGGAFSCDGQKFGSGWISAGGRDAISVALASSPFEVHWGYCLAKPGDTQPLAVNPHWDGKQVNVTCR
ncbi:MAG: hypothetical protein ACOYM5_00605 [Caulobacter sp.]